MNPPDTVVVRDGRPFMALTRSVLAPAASPGWWIVSLGIIPAAAVSVAAVVAPFELGAELAIRAVRGWLRAGS